MTHPTTVGDGPARVVQEHGPLFNPTAEEMAQVEDEEGLHSQPDDMTMKRAVRILRGLEGADENARAIATKAVLERLERQELVLLELGGLESLIDALGAAVEG